MDDFDFEEWAEEIAEHVKESYMMLGNVFKNFPDVDKVYKDYAKKLGKEVTQLTTVEKQQAILNYTIDNH